MTRTNGVPTCEACLFYDDSGTGNPGCSHALPTLQAVLVPTYADRVMCTEFLEREEFLGSDEDDDEEEEEEEVKA